MERLTFDGNFCEIAKCQNAPGGTFCETGMCSQRKVWERLKEWEDTGLDLEDLHLNVDIDYCRLIELLKADAENRLVVLPCKVGAVLYRNTYSSEVYEVEVDRQFVRAGKISLFAHPILEDGNKSPLYEVFSGYDIGKTVFLTQEEAEAALKDGAD